jgi:formate C-acetyltransferase
MATIEREMTGVAADDVERFSSRIARLHARLQARMLRPQARWQPPSVLDRPELATLPLVVRRAHASARVLTEMPIEIADDELIVGTTAVDGVITRTSLPEFATAEEHARALAEGFGITSSLSHKAPDYPAVTDRGLRAILDEIDAKAAEIAARPASPERDEKLLFMESMRIELAAVIALANRYAALAEALAAAEPARAAELRQIAAVCRRVPEFPARTFQEAIQGVWFVHYAFTSTKTNLSLGRLDQYLGPYLEADLAAGRLTDNAARDLADCLWLKFNDRASLRREDHLAQVATHPIRVGCRQRDILATDLADALNHFGQNILLGGLRPDGVDGANAATYLFLSCLERFEFTSPVVTVRLHRGAPGALVRRCAEVLKGGGGMPYIDNDDVLVPAYQRLGVPVEDARDYVNSNCWETMIAGASDQELIRGINFLLLLEWALNRGVTRCRGGREGVDTGDPRAFATFDELLDAWKRQLDDLVSRNIDYVGARYFACDLYHSGHGRYSFNPLLSALTRDCIAREADVIRGGARYVIWHVMGEAVANCIDALAAIKTLVFEQRTVDMATLLDALECNWQGHETLRQQLIARAPKFANDRVEADAIGRELMRWFVARTAVHARRYPAILFPCSVGTFSWYASIGAEVGASCDGRFAGEPIAPNFSPTVGMDVTGPTAAIKSYVQMAMTDLAAGAPIDLRFAGSSLRGEAGAERLRAFIQAFIALGGNMLTITVTDAELLRRAMAEPLAYRGLRVRMGGWSAYFVALSREQQLLHIAKVEHGIA